MTTEKHEWEFSPQENDIVDVVASQSTMWGTLSVIASLLCFGVGVASFAGIAVDGGWRYFVPVGVVELTIGVSFLGAGAAFRSIVKTEGSDVSHMLRALKWLSRALLVQIALAVGVLGLLAFSAERAIVVLAEWRVPW